MTPPVRFHHLIAALAVLASGMLVGIAPVQAQPDASSFMQGFPPDSGKRVTKANWFVGPFNRWGLQHVREITATQEISRGTGPVSELTTDYRPLLDLEIEDLTGNPGSVRQWLHDSHTDGFLVLHQGRIATEIYLNGMTERSYHNLFSVTKSFTGNLAGILHSRGELDLGATAASYVPELAGSAYEFATIQHLLDMAVGVKFVEDYADITSDIFRHAQATNAAPNPQNLTIYGVLPSYPREGDHGQQFHYVTANTDALGWVLQRASGERLADLLSTEIWSKLGAERDAYIISDLDGTAWVGGGLNVTLRDAARFGQMMLQNGVFNGGPIMPPEWIATLAAGDDYSTGRHETLNIGYKNKWWIYHDLGGYAARGVAGQRIVVIPHAGIVIVKFSSWPQLGSYHPSGEEYDVRAYQAIIQALSPQ